MISLSTSNSGSNWLDRLRSSRGFPTGAQPDLDRFLASSSSSSSTTQPDPSTRSESTQSFRQGKSPGASLSAEISDVLCDLFVMGECSRSFSKQRKSRRKQSNPKCFNGGGVRDSATLKTVDTSNNGNELCSSDDLRRENSENAVASSGDNSLNDKNVNNNNSNNGEHVVDHKTDNDHRKCDDDGDGDEDLKGFTRNEVTVIDTSCKEWKSNKWVFRKKESDEWKIKDKKSCFRGGRKRKSYRNDDHELEMKNEDDIHGKEMKKKKKKRKILLLNQVQSHNEPSNIVIGKAPRSRFPCPRPPEKPRPESSPVILLKSMPPSNTDVVAKLGIHKEKRKKMKII